MLSTNLNKHARWRKESTMANEYLNAWENFNSLVEEGLTLSFGERKVKVHSVNEYFEEDEVACEEQWANIQSDNGLSCVISAEDALNGEDLIHVLERQAEDSFISETFDDFGERIQELNLEDFLDYLEKFSTHELQILRHMVRM